MNHWEQWPARKLVEIDIEGTRFYLDLRLWQCRQTDNWMNSFHLDDVFITDQGIELCFDPVTKNLFRGTSEEFEQRRPELKMLRFPPLQKLDPVGYRALLGLPPIPQKQELLIKKRNPIKKGKRI